MATTAIWNVRDRLDRVINYAANPDKTKHSYQCSNEFEGLNNVLNYTKQDYKTEKQLFVTGINCDPIIASKQMMQTKKQYQKTGGILAFHAYQAFAPGEATPQTAHAIGVKLAQKLWGERFEVVVSTHLDKQHLHNHFVLNSVSFIDGRRFYDNHKSYDFMRLSSDELCKQHALSVIEEPKSGRSMHYSEWMAKQDGTPTWRGLIREDVDLALSSSLTYQQFINKLKRFGYDIKTNVKYIAIRPNGKDRYVRLRSLGDNYTEEAIKERIVNGKKEKVAYKVTEIQPFKKSSLRGLYYHYLYALGIIGKNKRVSSNETPFFMREKLLDQDHMSREYQILAKNHINTYEQLTIYKAACEKKINTLANLNKEAIDVAQKTVIGKQIKVIRKEIIDCDHIAARSIEMFQEQRKYSGELENEKTEGEVNLCQIVKQQIK